MEPSLLTHLVMSLQSIAATTVAGGNEPRSGFENPWYYWSFVVGRTGLEPVTPCVSCKCATRLRQRPLEEQPYHFIVAPRSPDFGPRLIAAESTVHAVHRYCVPPVPTEPPPKRARPTPHRGHLRPRRSSDTNWSANVAVAPLGLVP